MSNPFAVGMEVERTQGGCQKGDRGTVVEILPERVRVYWHTYNGAPNKTPKRTWMAPKALRALPTVAPQI